MKKSLLAAFGLILFANAGLLLGVWRNRSGPPDSELRLTDRELVFPGRRAEDSTLTLHLRWQNTAPLVAHILRGGRHAHVPGWFDQRKLLDLGFDCSVPATATEASEYYRRSLPRNVFVALEYDGLAWRQWLQDRESVLRYQTEMDRASIPFESRWEDESRTESRLVMIDASLTPEDLRRKHPDRNRVIILRALARVVVQPDPVVSYLRGAVTRLLTEDLYVPPKLGLLIDDSRNEKPSGYSVVLRNGSRYEPWIAALSVN